MFSVTSFPHFGQYGINFTPRVNIEGWVFKIYTIQTLKKVICGTNAFYTEGEEMGDTVWERRQRRGPGEAIISAIAVGAVFILIGMVFVLASPNNLWDKIVAFFSNLTTRDFPNTTITLPAPANPGAHGVLYTALFQFSFGIAILQVIILALRLAVHSRLGRIAETIGNLIFWAGATYLISVYLNSSTTLTMWFSFWAALLITIGLSIVVRVLVQMAGRSKPSAFTKPA